MFNYNHGDVGSKTAKFETHIPAQELHFLETINHNFVASIFLGKKSGIQVAWWVGESLYGLGFWVWTAIITCVAGDGLHVAVLHFGNVQTRRRHKQNCKVTGKQNHIPVHGLQLLEAINQHVYACCRGKIPKIGTSSGVTSQRNSLETPGSLDSNLLDNLTLVIKSCSAFEAAATMQARLAGCCSPSGWWFGFQKAPVFNYSK